MTVAGQISDEHLREIRRAMLLTRRILAGVARYIRAEDAHAKASQRDPLSTSRDAADQAAARLLDFDPRDFTAINALLSEALTELQHRRAAEAGKSNYPEIPEGWVMVPREPTDEMVRAAMRTDLSYMPGNQGPDRAAVYRAMLAASPSSPASGVRVKALEWVQLTSRREDGPPEPIAEWEATCLAGIYSITDEGGEWFLSLATLMDVIPNLGRSSDPDALRAVAQSDFAGRILSALGEHP